MKDGEKKFSEMTDKEILRRQLELLAEGSRDVMMMGQLSQISMAMVSIYDRLQEAKSQSI